MKKIITFATVFVLAMMIAQRLNAFSNLSKNVVFNKGMAAYQAIISPFQAGYGYSQEEKKSTQEEVNILEQEKKDTKKLQIITGNVWSHARKRVWAGVVLSGVALVAYKFFGPSIITIVTEYRKNSVKLAEEQEILLRRQQQKLLIEEEKSKKEAEELEMQKQQEEAKNRVEQIVREQEQNKRSARKQEQDRSNQAIIDAQERVRVLQQELVSIDSLCNSNDAVDKEIVDQRDSVKTNLLWAQEELESCISNKKSLDKRSKEENRQLIEAQKKEFFEAQERENREMQIKMLKAAGETVVQGASAGVAFAARFAKFVLGEVAPRADALLTPIENLDQNYKF